MKILVFILGIVSFSSSCSNLKKEHSENAESKDLAYVNPDIWQHAKDLMAHRYEKERALLISFYNDTAGCYIDLSPSQFFSIDKMDSYLTYDEIIVCFYNIKSNCNDNYIRGGLSPTTIPQSVLDKQNLWPNEGITRTLKIVGPKKFEVIFEGYK